MHSSLQELKKFKKVDKVGEKHILKLLRKRFGIKKFDYLILKSGKHILRICSKEMKDFDFSNLKVISLGLEFATFKKFFRIKFDAAPLLKTEKNVIELDEKEFIKWLKGEVFEKNFDDGVYLLKFKQKIVGCTLIQNRKVLNFVPKHRRLE
jgi:NOL1/NOP2/fmu family ribosome biogenesis protein